MYPEQSYQDNSELYEDGKSFYESDVVSYKLRLFDYVLGLYVFAMIATNYSAYKEVVTNFGIVVSLLFIVSVAFSQYRFYREFYFFISLWVWMA